MIAEKTPTTTPPVASDFAEDSAVLPGNRYAHVTQFFLMLLDNESDFAEYQIPDGHSAILCPTLLPIGTDGDDAADSIIFGHDSINENLAFVVENVVDSTSFDRSIEVSNGEEFATSEGGPRSTVFKGGDTLRNKFPIQGQGGTALKTGYSALLVSPH